MSSLAQTVTEALPDPEVFQPKRNPAFILHGALKTTFEELPVPDVGPDEVLVEVKKTSNQITVYHNGGMGLYMVKEAMCLGHESSGIIVRLGSTLAAAAAVAKDGQSIGKTVLRIGDNVTLEPGETCRMCHDCRGGHYNVRISDIPMIDYCTETEQLCEHMAFAATPPTHGTLQRYYKLPADSVYLLPKSLPLVYGAMMEPLSVAVHSVANVGGMRTGWNVLVMGAGPVGLLCMAVAKALGGHRIIAVDINEERLNFAKSYAATDIHIPIKPEANESRPQHSARAARNLLSTLGIPERGLGSIDLVVDATGAESCIQIGINIVKPASVFDQPQLDLADKSPPSGTYVQTGFGPPDVQIPMFKAVTNEVNIKGAWRYSNGDYPLAIDLVARGLVDLKPLLTHTFKFEDALEAFEITKNGKDRDGKPVIKCVINGPE
ncbi:hypothetical protein P7C73_g5264, partial [Tremellales sp. Uapishka_1]